MLRFDAAKLAHLKQYLGSFTAGELAQARTVLDAADAMMSERLAFEAKRASISIANWTDSLPPKPAGIASIGNGIFVRTGKRGA